MTKESREERKKKVIDVLNKARSMELQAIYQYMNQHYNLDDKDYGELAAKIKLIAVDEMQHAEDFAERIKELGDEPTTELADKVVKGQDVKQAFAFDSNLEDDTVDAYNEFLNVCRENGDSTTGKLFERIIDEEQEHLNYFDDVGEHIEELGQAYLAKIAGTSSATGLNTQGFVARQGGGGAEE
jgi:bacterioferritin